SQVESRDHGECTAQLLCRQLEEPERCPSNSFSLNRNAATRKLRRRGTLAAATNDGSAGAIAASVTPSHALAEARRARPAQRRVVGSWLELGRGRLGRCRANPFRVRRY